MRPWWQRVQIPLAFVGVWISIRRSLKYRSYLGAWRRVDSFRQKLKGRCPPYDIYPIFFLSRLLSNPSASVMACTTGASRLAVWGFRHGACISGKDSSFAPTFVRQKKRYPRLKLWRGGRRYVLGRFVKCRELIEPPDSDGNGGNPFPKTFWFVKCSMWVGIDGYFGRL